MADGYDCNVLQTADELEDFRSSWQELWCQDIHATPFQSPAWLLPWWHQFGQPGLRAAALWRHSRLVAFLPFYVYRESTGSERRLFLIGAGISDYLDGVFAPDCTDEGIKFALNIVLSAEGWDALCPVQLRSSSRLLNVLRLEPKYGGSLFETAHCSRRRAVPVDELPTGIRKNVHYYRNRARRTGDLTLAFANEQNWRAAFDSFVELHSTRWRDKGQTGVLVDPECSHFTAKLSP